VETTDHLFHKHLVVLILNGIVIFKGNWMKGDKVNWLKEFQERVNQLAESNHLTFTGVVWGQERDDKIESLDITVAKAKRFPYLDMEMYWDNTYIGVLKP